MSKHSRLTFRIMMAEELVLQGLPEAEQRQMAGEPLVRQLDDALFHLRNALKLSQEADRGSGD